MKRCFHCKKVEGLKGNLIVILSRSEESLIGGFQRHQVTIRDVFRFAQHDRLKTAGSKASTAKP